MTSSDVLEQARAIHAYYQRLRLYIQGGEAQARIWGGMTKTPTLPQIRTLFALHFLGACQLKDLGKLLEVSDPAASEMVERLVELGLVSRTQDSGDRRRVVLALTAQARTRVEAHERHVLERIVLLMQELGPAAALEWIAIAEKLLAAMERLEPAEHGRR